MDNELILTDDQGTPAGYGDTVQYILDKLGNEALGPELVDPQGWNVDQVSGWTVENGELIGTDGAPPITQTFSPISSRLCLVSFAVDFFEETNSAPLLNMALGNSNSVLHRINVQDSRGGGGSKTVNLLVEKFANQIQFVSNRYVTGVPNFSGRIKNISVRELKGTHALQTNSSLKPVRGRVPVGGRRNLLPSTDLEGWGRHNISISAYQDPEYPNAITLTDTADSIDRWHFAFARVFPTNESPFCGRFLAKAGTLSKIGFRTRYISDNSEIVVIDLMTGNLSSSVDVMGEVIFETSLLANGWVEIKFTAASGQSDSRYDAFGLVLVSDSADGTYSSNLYIGDGNGTVHIAQPQGELGVEQTEFQRVTSNLDIYEPGAQHTEYLRFDHVDDKLVQTFPDGFTGDLVVCGTEGSWIDKDVTVAAGSDLTIGPKNLPNTAGILPALGDIIGWVPVGKSLTSAEQRAIVDYYKGRGAKGKLVPSGVELVTNGTFDSDLSGWNAGSWVWDSGMALADSVASTLAQGVGSNGGEGKAFLVKWKQTTSGRIRPRIRDRAYSQDLYFNYEWGDKDFERVIISLDAGLTLQFLAEAGNVVYLDNVSVQELIPEEDLA